MDANRTFPLKFLLNLSRRQDRRDRCVELFASLGWQVERLPAVDARVVKSARGFQSPGRYAHALSTRLILRRAALAGAEAVLIMEDDIVVPPDLNERLAALELPEDWAILYLGCQHHERPDVVAQGLVRVRAALDTHAWAVRAPYYLEVRRALAGRCWNEPGPLPAADILLTELARRVPAYAAYPNLAWQQEDVSDLLGGFAGNYDADGSARPGIQVLPGLLAESLGGSAWPQAVAEAKVPHAWFWPPQLLPPQMPHLEPAPPPEPLGDGDRIAFLFLTRGDHSHAELWEEYWAAHPDRVSVYAHSKDRTDLHGWLAAAQISEYLPTSWGGLSLVRAQMALLAAALQDERNRFFVFASESCLPIRPLADLVRLLSCDGRSRLAFATPRQVEKYHPGKLSHLPAGSPIPQGQFQFHSQWILLHREAAELLVANTALLSCFEDGTAPDEFAFGTLLQAAGYPFETRVANADITWTMWLSNADKHPLTFHGISPALAGDLMASGCFFARKFHPGAVLPDALSDLVLGRR